MGNLCNSVVQQDQNDPYNLPIYHSSINQQLPVQCQSRLRGPMLKMTTYSQSFSKVFKQKYFSDQLSLSKQSSLKSVSSQSYKKESPLILNEVSDISDDKDDMEILNEEVDVNNDELPPDVQLQCYAQPQPCE
ncbi:Hypothetical_protein [Hexamita inflata]|uniref:Hypothetical_protein n=1 Tax=Hexamita inflata TaxID=28002 RepID=A0AA86TVJ3_9EUKA|nr:Hypothetical protein HINF_LOCUS10878 [Hexamita inflata]